MIKRFPGAGAPARLTLLAALLCLAVLALHLVALPRVAFAEVRVDGDGDCLRLRATPGLDGDVVTCIPDGSVLDTLSAEVTVDGLRWRQVRTSGDDTGWVAAEYLVELATPPASTPAPPAATPTPEPAPPPLRAFPAPPPGGLSIGLSGTSSPTVLIEAQSFPVAAVSRIVPGTQDYLIYIVGAPSFANSLTGSTLRAGDAVMVRRTGDFFDSPSPPAASGATPPVTGTPALLDTPPPGGLTQGVAGTNDVGALVAAQRFTADLALVLDEATQYWYTYIRGAPDFVNSLDRSSLTPDSVVTMRREPSAAPPPATPPPPPPPGAFVPTAEQLETPPGPAGNQ
ncbi:MAG: SH3 domain-containing protein [Dehalococcoidia bacterium]